MEGTTQEELKNYGFFRIMLESLKTLSSQRKLFGQLTVTLLLPFSLVFLTYLGGFVALLGNLISNENSFTYKKLYLLLLANLGIVSILITLSLLWIGAAVYAVACAYSNKQITLGSIIRCVPKIWKKVVVAYIWSRFFALCLGGVMVGLLFCVSLGWNHMAQIWRVFLVVVILVFYCLELAYTVVLWGIASVVSVVEDVYGLKSLIRSKELVRGKMMVAGVYAVILGGFIVGIELLEGFLVVFPILHIGLRVLIAVVCVVLFVMALLVAPVFQTILYLVCMSNHHQAVDMRLLSDHLEAYRGHYLRLPEASIQMDRLQNV